jgi:hypothetical protein
MTINPFHINGVANVYNKFLKQRINNILEKEQREEPQDVVSISAEAKKRIIIEQAKEEVLKTIKESE